MNFIFLHGATDGPRNPTVFLGGLDEVGIMRNVDPERSLGIPGGGSPGRPRIRLIRLDAAPLAVAIPVFVLAENDFVSIKGLDKPWSIVAFCFVAGFSERWSLRLLERVSSPPKEMTDAFPRAGVGDGATPLLETLPAFYLVISQPSQEQPAEHKRGLTHL